MRARMAGRRAPGRFLRRFRTRPGAANHLIQRMLHPSRFGRHRLHDVAATFPDAADTLLLDTYLTDEESASSRLFRVYRETPPHYHAGSDEHLYVMSGRGTFWIGEKANGGEFAPGDFLCFKRGTVHAFPQLLETPVVFLAIDAPRRDPKDIVFVNPEDGTPETFIQDKNP